MKTERQAAHVDALPKPPRRPDPFWQRRSVNIGIALLGLVIVLVLMNTTIAKYEQHLATGDTVLLELAPVDPRGFMQGDYMALGFAIDDDIREALGKQSDDLYLENSEGKVVVAKDVHDVGHFVRLLDNKDTEKLAGNELALYYRVRNGQVKFATNAFFFQEGHAEAYEEAEFGVFRVNDKGEPLLTGLAGDDFAAIVVKDE